MALIQKAFSDIITFSRSSNATRIGPTGLVEYAPHNLLLQSQTFGTTWSPGNASVSSNAIAAPDGTVTADKLVENSGAGVHDIYQGFSASAKQYTVSIYAKAAGRDWFSLRLDPGTSLRVYFNVSTGTVGYVNPAFSGYSITSVGNGWYRCTATITATAATWYNVIELASANLTVSYTGDGTSGIYLWGAQLSVGPYPLDYTPTTSAAVYGPRFDYDPVTLAARGLLIEEQRTNLLTYSEQFDNAVWGTASNVTITANATTAPDGTLNADTMTEVATNATHRVEAGAISGSSVATQYSVSCYFKIAAGTPWARFGLTDATGAHQLNAWFDLQNGVVGSTSVSGSGVLASRTITSVGSGWYRCVMTGTVTGGTGTVYLYIGMANADLAVSYLGSTSRSVYLWGAQLEAGSFATSYIPTLAASVTRSADVASVNTLSPWFNATEGTLYAEWTPRPLTGSRGVASLNDGTSSELIEIRQDVGDGNFLIVDGTTQANLGVGALTANATAKVAGGYKLNDVAASLNGGTIATDTAATLPTVTALELGARGGTYLSGHIRRIAYYPRRLTNAELVALSA